MTLDARQQVLTLGSMKLPATLTLAALSAVIVFGQPSENREIPAAEVGSRIKIIGSLGKPLGEKIQITGTFPTRPQMLANPLALSTIDGKPPGREIQIEVDQSLHIEKGITYTLIGYESGGFSSAPAWAYPEGAQPQQPFQFKTFFVPVKVVEKKQP